MSSDPEQDLPSREPGRECVQCGSPLREDQDWCLSCGRGAPGALASGAPGWRSAGAIATAAAVLLAGTAVAAYAALNQHHPPAPPAVALTPPTTNPAPAPPVPTGATGPTGPTGPTTLAPPAGTPPPTKPATAPKAKPTTSKPAKPNPAPPTASEQHSGPASEPTPTGARSAEHANEAPETGAGTAEPPPSNSEALLLDTNAASAYNPCRYPASGFGTPYEAIDGERTSAWRAVIEPGATPEGPPRAPGVEPGQTGTTTGATGPTGPTAKPLGETETGANNTTTGAAFCEAPATGVGLALDLTAPQRLATVALYTSTPGMTVAVYGTNAETLSTSTAWTQLASARQIKKRSSTIRLNPAANAYRFALVWISKAPSGATGAQAGRVALDEVELLPPSAKSG